MLIIEPDDGPNIPQAIQIMEQLNLEYVLLDREELRRRYPQLHYPPNYRGLLDPHAGLQAPDTILKLLQVRDGFVNSGNSHRVHHSDHIRSDTSHPEYALLLFTVQKLQFIDAVSSYIIVLIYC